MQTGHPRSALLCPRIPVRADGEGQQKCRPNCGPRTSAKGPLWPRMASQAGRPLPPRGAAVAAVGPSFQSVFKQPIRSGGVMPILETRKLSPRGWAKAMPEDRCAPCETRRALPSVPERHGLVPKEAGSVGAAPAAGRTRLRAPGAWGASRERAERTRAHLRRLHKHTTSGAQYGQLFRRPLEHESPEVATGEGLRRVLETERRPLRLDTK